MSLIRRQLGAWLIAGAALLGAIVSTYNYFTPLTGIDGTPGALLVIGSSLILLLFAVILATCSLGPALRRFLTASSLLDVAGTAFAAYLLESQSLLMLMAVCFAGWLMLIFAGRQIAAAPITRHS